VKRSKPRLIAVDGIDASAVVAAAKKMLGPPGRGGISHWDASGVFQELDVAGPIAGAPGPRTLLLLYAADLAFRLRWEIRPALAEGRTVIAAPYVETAVAFGRAAGVPQGWLENLFRFAPRPHETCFVHRTAKRARGGIDGFVGFGCARLGGRPAGRTPKQIVAGAAKELRRRAVSALRRPAPSRQRRAPARTPADRLRPARIPRS
jgi:hypothetical protein